MKMKNTGISRKVDTLGRVVIPKEIRDALSFDESTMLELWCKGEDIILRVKNTKCSICGNVENLIEFKGKFVCRACVDFSKKMTE